MAASDFGMVEEVRVLLVGNGEEFVPQFVDFLQSYDYKVLMVDTAPAAMSLLSKGKQQIDVMIINIHSSNKLCFDLLAQAMSLDIMSLVVCDKDDELAAKKALEEGAYLCLDKPFNKEVVKYLWQFILRKKLQRDKARRLEKHTIIKQKGCMEWTDELHGKFVEVIHQLGKGKCYPKEIVKMMNVPGLTRMQVASHLQKYRHNNWRSPNEQKSIRRPSGPGSSCGYHEPVSSFRKFGTMPRFQVNVQNPQCNPPQIQRGPFDNIFAQRESSIQQFYHPQLQVQPHYFTIWDSFNNPFSSAQIHQQQHASLSGMLGSQGPQGPIIRSTNYRPNHTLNGHRLDLNVAQRATNSVGGPMSSIVDNMNVKVEPDEVYSGQASTMGFPFLRPRGLDDQEARRKE